MKDRDQLGIAKKVEETNHVTAGDLRLPDPHQPLAQQAPEILLGMCLFGEARGEDERTRRAVAQVVLNRVRHPHRVFGSRRGAGLEENLCRVILKPRQFSCFNAGDPNYAKLLSPLDYEAPAVWAACLRSAEQALAEADQADTLTGNSDHYFDESLQPPSWADPAKQTARIGRLRFYRLYLPPPADSAPAARESSQGVAVVWRRDGPAMEAIPSDPPAQTLPAAATAGRMGLQALSAAQEPTARTRPPMSLPAPSHPTSRIVGSYKRGWTLRSGRLSSPSTWLPSTWLRASGAGLVLLLGLVWSGCSDFERTAYRTLAVTRAEYETVEQHAVEAVLHGLISEEQWDRFQVAAHRFVEAHNAAVDAFELWSKAKTKSNAARLAATLEILPRLVREINSLIESFEKEQVSGVR